MHDYGKLPILIFPFGDFGADDERFNIDVLRAILTAMGQSEDVFDLVRDRPRHDCLCAIDSTKFRCELDWEPAHTDFSSGLEQTIAWRCNNKVWWRPAKTVTKTKCARQGQ